ncbi:MAG: GYF domain-containing protein, partial [Byssovorax sp.]
QSKYTVSDEKVQGKTVKIKCRKCGATILVNSSGATTTAAGAGEAVSVSTSAGELGVSFLVNVAEGDQRTMSLVEVVEAYNSSVVTAETYVWSDGMGDWQPLGQVESIVSALNSGAAAAAPEPAAYAAPEPAPYAAAPYAAAAAPAAAAAAPYAVAAAPTSQPAAESAPRAAARRDTSRRGPDLFGGGMAAEEVATSAPAFNGRAPSPMASSGQREENSMLFSLSALTAKAAPSGMGSSSSKTSASGEDSGLIDLKALADGAGSNAPSNYVPDHAGLFPLGAPQVAAPVMTAPAAMMSVAPPPASKAPIFIGVGIAVAALAIVGAFFAMKGSDPPPVVATETAPTAAPTPPPVVEPPPTATAVVAAPTASASAAVATAVKAPIRSGGGKATPTAGTGKAGGGATTPTATTPPVKKSSCGCAAGDLLCAMKCSAK